MSGVNTTTHEAQNCETLRKKPIIIVIKQFINSYYSTAGVYGRCAVTSRAFKKPLRCQVQSYSLTEATKKRNMHLQCLFLPQTSTSFLKVSAYIVHLPAGAIRPFICSPASHCIQVIWTSVKVVGFPPPLVSFARPFLLNQLRLMGLSVQAWLRIKFNPIWLPFLPSKARTITIWWRLPALTNRVQAPSNSCSGILYSSKQWESSWSDSLSWMCEEMKKKFKARCFSEFSDVSWRFQSETEGKHSLKISLKKVEDILIRASTLFLLCLPGSGDTIRMH